MASSSMPLVPGSAEKRNGPGADDGMVGDALGGLEVALQPFVLHELHRAVVGEALAADGVAGEVAVDVEINGP